MLEISPKQIPHTLFAFIIWNYKSLLLIHIRCTKISLLVNDTFSWLFASIYQCKLFNIPSISKVWINLPSGMFYLCSRTIFLSRATDSVCDSAWHHCFSWHSSNWGSILSYFKERFPWGPPATELSAVCWAFTLSSFRKIPSCLPWRTTLLWVHVNFTPTCRGGQMPKSGHRTPQTSQSDELIYRNVSLELVQS